MGTYVLLGFIFQQLRLFGFTFERLTVLHIMSGQIKIRALRFVLGGCQDVR